MEQLKKSIKNKEILMEHVSKLRDMKLPPKWKVAKLDVVFRREGFNEQSASVVYDSMNDCFYVRTDKVIVYENNKKAVLEGINIMKKANKIIKPPKVVGDK